MLTALATLSVITGTFLVAGTALAVNPSSTGLFELDTSTSVPPCPVTTPATTVCGNANTADNPAGGADDWANVYKSATGLGSAAADHAFARTFITDPTGAAENSFYTGGGSKDVNDISQWQYGTSNDPVPDKDDIANLFAAAYTATGGHTILYFGMDRFDNNGDSETGFWFFKSPVSLNNTGGFSGVHTTGDVLVLADWGGSSPVGDITVYQWVGGKNPLTQLADNANGDCALAGASQNFCAVVNRTTETPTQAWPFLDKSASTAIRPLELFEAGIDLNAVLGSDQCFSTFLGATRSSHSTTAQLKDFALGNFEKCGASLTTQVSATNIFVGQTVTDSATVHANGGTNPPAPTGIVTFKLDGAAFDTENLSTAVKSGDDYTVTTSVSYTATTPGHFCFNATWPGDGNYKPAAPATVFSDDGTNECFDVADTTSASSAQDWLPNDSGTITSAGGTALNGSLSFTLYSGLTCDGTILRAAETFTLTGAASPATRTTTNTATKVLTTQGVSWLVQFTSSDPLVGSSSHCETTSLTITN
jgi:hypothetical protein